MTAKLTNPSHSLTLAEIDAIVVQARAYRADAMREMLGKASVRVASLFKRLAAHLRPSRERLPHSGAWVRS